MTIKQKIRKAKAIYTYTRTSDADGTYIKVSKSAVMQSLRGDEEHDYFKLRECGDLYIN